MSACFAYSKDRLRCDQEAGHEGHHTFTTYWTDDECFDPMLDSTTVWRDKPVSPTGDIKPMVLTNAVEDPLDLDDEPDGSFDTGSCDACGCPEHRHGKPCEPHGCRNFVP